MTPQITTGVLHAHAGTGQIGAGVAHQPVEPFRAALAALAESLWLARSGPAPGRCARCTARGRSSSRCTRGGYVRLGDELRLLRRAPRAPRGPLTVLVSGLERPAAPATARTSTATRCTSARTRSRWSRAPASPSPPTPLDPAGGGARAPRSTVIPRRSSALAAGLAALRAGDLASAVAALAGRGRASRRRATTSSRATPRWSPRGRAHQVPLQRSRSDRCSPLGLAYLRCAERGELPEVVGACWRRSGRDAGLARRRARGLCALGRELRRCHALGRRERTVNEIGPNFIARPYRGVSVQDAESARRGAAAAPAARPAGLPADRVHRRRLRRRARAGPARARGRRRILVAGARRARARRAGRRSRSSRTSRSTPATRAAGAAAPRGRAARVYVVQGRFQHVNFIVEPAPLRIRVRRGGAAAPAEAAGDGAGGARLRRGPAAAGARVRGDRPARAGARAPGRALPVPVPLLRARARRGGRLPGCRARRSPRDWTLVGCERSRQIHVALYGAEPHERVDFCPRRGRAATERPDAAQVLPARARDRAGATAGSWSRGARAWKRSAQALHRLAAA